MYLPFRIDLELRHSHFTLRNTNNENFVEFLQSKHKPHNFDNTLFLHRIYKMFWFHYDICLHWIHNVVEPSLEQNAIGDSLSVKVLKNENTTTMKSGIFKKNIKITVALLIDRGSVQIFSGEKIGRPFS